MERGTTRRARVFAAAVDRDVATLSAEESHHVTRVLRLLAGDEVVVFDGAGHEWIGSIAGVRNGSVTVALGASRDPIAEPLVSLVVAVGLLKGTATADVIRDATMLGVHAVVPFVSAHTALPGSASRAGLAERWRRIAIASAKQSGRATVPAIHEVTTFDAALAVRAAVKLMCVEPHEGGAARAQWPQQAPTALLLSGPEGGWSRHELDQARDAGAIAITLGPRTLRAEIAPAIGVTALWTAWGWP